MPTPVGSPTEPGLRSPGGSGLQAIWCAASVMPYASTTGTPNASSSAAMSCGGRDEEQDRTNRSQSRRSGRPSLSARARMAWCIVGTAVYHVGRNSSSQSQNRAASKPGVQTTLPPAPSELSTAATRPWMWKSGMTLRHRSAGPSASERRTLPAEAQRLACVSGTIFGRDVVPDVCSTRATSCGPGEAGRSALPGCRPVQRERAGLPAGRRAQLQHGEGERARHRPRRALRAGRHDEALRAEIGQVELEFRLAVCGVEGRTGGPACDGQEGEGHLRTVGQDDGHAVPALEAQSAQPADDAVHLLGKAGVGQRRAAGGQDGGGVRGLLGPRGQQVANAGEVLRVLWYRWLRHHM